MTQIKNEMPQAAQLLAFLAYVDHQDIWYELLHVGEETEQPLWFRELTSDKFVFIEAMIVLTRYCLVETHHDTDSYSLHTCVHDWTLDGLNREINWKWYWLAFDCVASHVGANSQDYLSETQYRRFVGHTKRLMHDRFGPATDQKDSIRTRLDQFCLLAVLLDHQQQHNAAEQIYLFAIAGSEKALGPNHISTLEIIKYLGSFYHQADRQDEAKAMYLRALAGFEKALGTEHTTTLNTIFCLSDVYHDLGRPDEAEQFYQRALDGYKKALDGREKTLGRYHISTLEALNYLADLYNGSGRYQEAEATFLEGLARCSKALGLSHPKTLVILNNIGHLYWKLGLHDLALAFCLRALAGWEEALGSDNVTTIKTVSDVGELYRDLGSLEEAEKYYLLALARYEKVLGQEHKWTLDTVSDLGNLYRDLGRLDDARVMFERLLAGTEKAFGLDHSRASKVANDLKELVLALDAEGKEAQPLRDSPESPRKRASQEYFTETETILQKDAS